MEEKWWKCWVVENGGACCMHDWKRHLVATLALLGSFSLFGAVLSSVAWAAPCLDEALRVRAAGRAWCLFAWLRFRGTCVIVTEGR